MNIPDEFVSDSVAVEFGVDYDATNREHEVFLAGIIAGAEWARKEALREAAVLAEDTSEMAWSVAEARVGAWLAKSIRALAEGVSDGQQ